ncbi:nucleotide pyrophosphohydrolase [Deinococcus puniceus]|nr:nucleotide pyrophosphohydrolase [Deinococcus puniceus]
MRLVFSYSARMTDAVAPLTFEAARARVDTYISQFKEGYFPPLLMLARLTEETGEIARVIAHQNGKTPKPGEDVGDLELELADLLFVMICMANERGLSLERGFERMMTKVETRDADRWTRKVGPLAEKEGQPG